LSDSGEPRVAFVTGAGRGIGAATAAALAQEGAIVVLFDRDLDAVEARARALEKSGWQARAICGDVSSGASCQAAMTEIADEFGRLDVLVNNAAVGAFNATLDSLDEQQWDEVLSINLKSVFLVSRHALPLLRAAGGGCIVNLSSVHAHATTPGSLPYAAAKGGVLSLTRAMALELGPDGIRVVAVLPGAVDTPMLSGHVEKMKETGEEAIFAVGPTEIGRIGRPEEVAAVIAFLASPAASFANGTSLVVDGGLLAQL
jgi:NAD(P)-dependent dehydrogenase (short-subunit alcohol dehydrogenase family)